MADFKTASDVEFAERTEQIWLARDEGDAFLSKEAAWRAYPGTHLEPYALRRPTLAPIYGGETLLEALWSEMDRLMESLMTGAEADDVCGRKRCGGGYDDPDWDCDHPDNGDKYRAQELAWVIAICTNPYQPSVDAIRAEAVRRWNEMMEESHGD